MTEEAVKGKHSKPGGLLRDAIEFVIIIVVAILLALFVLNFVARPYEIPSGSMLETIQLQDRVLSEQVSYYFGEPQQGQIVTFKEIDDPDTAVDESETTLIKRVVAVGGQTVDIKNDAVYVDGEKLDEPYTLGKPTEILPSEAGIEYPFTVPEGYLWCMGDNRTDSSDSRVFGPVPVENVTGHAFLRYWPLSSFGLLE